MDDVKLRRLKDKLRPLRRFVIPTIQLGQRLLNSIGSLLRSHPRFRELLHLPGPRWRMWEEWKMEQNNPNLEISLDPPMKVTRTLPIGNCEPCHWLYRRDQETCIERTFVACIPQGHVWGRSGGIYFSNEREVIWDLGREHWMNYSIPAAWTRLWFPKPTRLPGTVAVVGHSDSYRNFAHWLSDLVPRFGLLERAGFPPNRIDKYLITHRSLPFQLETFEKIGIPLHKIEILEEETFITADNLVVPFLSSYWNMSHQKNVLRYLRQTFHGDPLSNTGTRRLFVSRQDARFRRLKQENELFSRLQAYGFEQVTLAGMGIEATAQLFKTAEMVVGPFGSGLMNIFFSPAGSTLLEIVCPTFFNCHHWHLSQENGLRHFYYIGKGPGCLEENGSMTDLTKDIDIDVDDFMKFFSELVLPGTKLPQSHD